MLATLALLSALVLAEAPASPNPRDEPAAKPTTPDHPNGRISLALGVADRINCLRIEGDWTEKRPFCVRFPLGPVIYASIGISLRKAEAPEHAVRAVPVPYHSI